MKVARGDVVLVTYPFASGRGQSRRPALVIQSDAYNDLIQNTVVAQITSNLARSSDPAHLLIKKTSPEGAQSGLLHDSVVSCINVVTLHSSRITRVIGSMPDTEMDRIDECLKVTFELTE